MPVRDAQPKEIARWDELLTQNPDGGNVFQAREMAETKRLGGWTPRYLIIDDIAVTVLEKHVPIIGNFWYLPKGPGISTVDTLLSLLPDLKTFAASHGVFAVKCEPEIIESEETHRVLIREGLVPTSPVQPNNSTVLLDLQPSLDTVLANLNQKGRHAIHRAERDGVRAMQVETNDANMRIMYDLLTSTAEGRFESSLRSYDYYREFWTSYAKNGHGALFFAEYDGQIVAAAYCLTLGTKGLYKDGASVRERTAYGASHLLQWEIIKWMKSLGVTTYDFCGAPHSSRINDESHPFYGVGRFKTSFNKHVTDYIGCYDLIVNPRAYRRWQRIGQRLTISLSWRLKHRQWL